MAKQNADLYPYWSNPNMRSLAHTIAAQDTRRKANNQIPLDDDFSQSNARVVVVPYSFQDSRRAGSGDKQIVGVGEPGYLFQRVMDSPVLTRKEE